VDVRRFGVVVSLACALLAPACATDTSTLTPESRQRFETEGIVRRADNVVVRHTQTTGRHETGYKDRLASVVVTKETVLIHQGEKVLLELTPRTRRNLEVRRQGDRLRIRAVGTTRIEVFSFQPPEDAPGWATDVRAVVALSQKKERGSV
jgi:hypothetical protein